MIKQITAQPVKAPQIVSYLQVFYGVQLAVALMQMMFFIRRASVGELAPNWASQWMSVLPFPLSLGLLFLLIFGAALWATLFPQQKAARIAIFAAMLELAAAQSSFRMSARNLDAWLYADLAFAFLTLAEERLDFWLMWCAQALALIPYFLAGTWKLRQAIIALFSGNSFSNIADGLSYHLSLNVLQGAMPTPLSHWLLGQPILCEILWPLVIALEVGVPLVLFRPRFARPYAAALITMHFAAALVMEIDYTPQIFALVLLFILWPRAAAHVD